MTLDITALDLLPGGSEAAGLLKCSVTCGTKTCSKTCTSTCVLTS
jgi:hypothetical protein